LATFCGLYSGTWLAYQVSASTPASELKVALAASSS
jgi:hypothetical protein